MKDLTIAENERIDDKIYTIRGVQVMLDEDLAKLYQVESKRLNEQVKRNIERFPEKFRFQLTADEYEILRSQIATLRLDKAWGTHRKYLLYAFTEQGVSMLSAVLKSQIAIEVRIKIIDSFVNMRKLLTQNSSIFVRLETIEEKHLKYKIESDEKFNQIFKAIEDKTITKKYHIFYDGQIFDAYIFVSDIIKSAKKSIKLIDNYIDESTFLLFTKKDENIKDIIFTKNISKELDLDLKKYNSQYPKIELKKFDLSHDRFLIIDDIEVYHFGASLKDLGKKWFAVSKMDINSFEMIGKIKTTL